MKVRFPRTCPVCGKPATKVLRLKIAKSGKQYLSRTWEYAYGPYVGRRTDTQQKEMKVIPIQVCEDHAHPDDGSERYQSLCLIIDGIIAALLVFGLLFVGDSISRARPIPLWSFISIALFGLALSFTVVAFRPNAVEQAVSIVGFDPGMQNVLLAIKRPDYRRELIQENQMTAELVSWIVRSDD